MTKQAPPKQRAMQAAVILVILSAWLLIGVSAFFEVGERRAGSAVLMIGQGLLVTGFGLAILRALQTGFGALDRFFGAILQRTERAGAAAGEASIEAQTLGLGSAPPVRHPSELGEARPAAQRAAAATSFTSAPQSGLEAQREAAHQRLFAAKAAAPQRALSAKPAPARATVAKAPAPKSARTAPAEKAPARSAPATRATPAAPAQPLQPARLTAPAPAAAPARVPAPAAPRQAPHPIEEGFLGDRAYRILSDGTVEVETLLGIRAFESLDVAREFIGAPRLRPEGAANEAYSSAA